MLSVTFMSNKRYDAQQTEGETGGRRNDDALGEGESESEKKRIDERGRMTLDRNCGGPLR